MVIETKFDVGEKVWFMTENHAVQRQIESIDINVYGKNLDIKYLFDREGRRFTKDGLFLTKQALLESL